MNSLAIRRAGAWIAGGALLAASAPAPAPAQTPPAATAVDLGGLETRSAALMLSAQEAGDLEVSVAAIPLPAAAAADDPAAPSRVVLVVDLDGDSLLAGIPPRSPEAAGQGGGDTLITEIYAYALTAGGDLADTLTRAFRLDLEASRQALAGGGVKFFGHLDLPPGDYSLRVLALHRRADRLGLVIMPLEVPAWSAATPALLPPVAHESAGRWLVVHEDGEPPPPFPVTIGGEPRLPATRWIVDAGASSPYLLLGRGLGPGLQAHLLDPSREQPLELGLGDLRAVAERPGGLEALAADLDAAGLANGEARLRISSAAGIEASAPVSIRAAEDAELWANEASPAPAGRPAARRRGSQAQAARVARADAAYRLALGALESGDHGRLFRPLVELERAEIGSGSTAEQRRLGEAELQAAWELAGGEAEGLLPMIWLHGELYRQYHIRQRYQLATHSRHVLSHLAELYLERRPTPEARHLAACALAGVAGYLQGIGALPAAEDAYRAVLEHQADHPAGLIGLATVRESYSDYETAARILERLLRQRPDDPHVGLRLGINLRRLGKKRRAEKLLRESLATPGPPWVSAVAAQELASLLAAEESWSEAIEVLEAAIQQHPDVQRLRLQLSSLLDRTDRPAAARAVLDGLDPAAGRDASSPRLRYSRMPTAAHAEARRTLAEEARRQLPSLLIAAPTPRPNAPAGSRREPGDRR